VDGALFLEAEHFFPDLSDIRTKKVPITVSFIDEKLLVEITYKICYILLVELKRFNRTLK